MNFDPDPRTENLRAQVRAFIAKHVDPDAADRRPRSLSSSRADVERWTRVLSQQGWLAPHWPKQWGGTDWTPLECYILEEELGAAYCPDTDRIATGLIGPVIIKYGSDYQRERYLPRILNADDFWCQGFSEPQAGSDLSLIRTRAVRQGDYYIVNGRKAWITSAHIADMMFALARITSSDKPGHGLSLLLIDMHDPGINVRPITTIDEGNNDREMLSEVFLEDVKVPVRELVGEEGQGWLYARSLITYERVIVPKVPYTKRALAMLKKLAATEQRNGKPLMEDARFRGKVSQLEIELTALEFLVLRMLYAGEDDPILDVLGPVVKLRGADLRQRVWELIMETLGERGLIYRGNSMVAGWDEGAAAHAGDVAAHFLWSRSASIAGGTSEVQRNLIAAIALQM